MKKLERITTWRYVRFSAAAMLLFSGAMMLPACAYFNTFYNAKRIYKEAEAERIEGTGRVASDKYELVVERCSKIVRDHPDSKWIDDAIFLMGKALVRQEEYNSGIRKFTELLTNFTESKFVPESYYWLALANYMKRDYNAGEVYIQRFSELYPQEDIRFEVYFLGGDISLMLEKPEEALAYYSLVADGAPEREMKDRAVISSAELFYDQEDWAQAASYYERALRKGITKELRFMISTPLGECYARTGRCEEALKLFDELLDEITLMKDKPKPLLGKAESYECMDSLFTAIDVYAGITKQFPKSEYSAIAYFQIGYIYQEKLDSLQKAQEAYSMVSKESPSSELAPIGLQRSNSLKRLLELQASASGEQTDEQVAQQRFLAAEIQLIRLDELELAVENYSAVVDSFPDTQVAPKAAYALAWIYERKMGDGAQAAEMYRHVIWSYPRSYQASGAIERLETLGEDDQLDLMQAYIDSALADTTGLAMELSRQSADSALADKTGFAVVPPGRSIDAAPVDTTGFAVQPSGQAGGQVPAAGVVIASKALWELIDSAWEEAARLVLQQVGQGTVTVPAVPLPDTTSAGSDSTKSEGGR